MPASRPADDENDAAAANNLPIRLFLKTWENPRPDVAIRDLDMVTGTQAAVPGTPAPFLVGLTVETAQPAAGSGS